MGRDVLRRGSGLVSRDLLGHVQQQLLIVGFHFRESFTPNGLRLQKIPSEQNQDSTGERRCASCAAFSLQTGQYPTVDWTSDKESYGRSVQECRTPSACPRHIQLGSQVSDI